MKCRPCRRLLRWVSGPHPGATDLADELVRALMVGMVALFSLGLIDLLLRRQLSYVVQPAFTAFAFAVTRRMLRRSRPRPIFIIVGALLAVIGYLASGVLVGDAEALSSSAPMVILTACATLIVAAGAGRPILVTSSLIAIGSGVWYQQMFNGKPWYAVLLDAATSAVSMSLAMFIVWRIREALITTKSSYEGLMATAPAPILVFDLFETRRVIATLGIRDMSQIEEMLEDQPDMARAVMQSAQIADLNPNALALMKATDLDGARVEWMARAVAADRPIGLCLAIAHMALAPQGERVVLMSKASENPVWLKVAWRTHPPRRHDVIAAAVDVTSQVRAEEVLAAQIKARDRFVATVSHELRTPLTAVLGLAEELRNGSDLPDALRAEMLGLVVEQSRDMSDIVQDLLVAARAEIGGIVIKPVAVELCALIEDVRSGDIAVEHPEDGVHVMGDPVRIRQVIRNLLTNARRHGGPNARMVVGRRDLVAYIEVRDDGKPIPPEERRRIFEPYQRAGATDLPTDSVGLGLSVARTLAQLMNGTVTYTHDGAESCFRLELPVAHPEASARTA